METVESVLTDNNQSIEQNTQNWANDHEEEFKECMGSYNNENGADLFEPSQWQSLFIWQIQHSTCDSEMHC